MALNTNLPKGGGTDFTPEEVAAIASRGGGGTSNPTSNPTNPNYQPRAVDFTLDEVAAAARYHPPSRLGQAARGAGKAVGELAEGAATLSGEAFFPMTPSPIELLKDPPAGPGDFLKRVVQTPYERTVGKIGQAVEAAKGTFARRQEEEAATGKGAVPNWMRQMETAARTVGIPFDVVGLPVTAVGEDIGAGIGGGDAERLGHAAGTVGGFVGLGAGLKALRGKGPPGPPGAPGAPGVPAPGAPGAPGAGGAPPPPGASRGGASRGGRPRHGTPEAPGAAPGTPGGVQRPFFWNHEEVFHAAPDATQGKVRLDYKSGKTEFVDPVEFFEEVWRQSQWIPQEFQGKRVVDLRLDSNQRRHKLWFEDGTSDYVPHQVLVDSGFPLPFNVPGNPFSEAIAAAQRFKAAAAARQQQAQGAPGAGGERVRPPGAEPTAAPPGGAEPAAPPGSRARAQDRPGVSPRPGAPPRAAEPFAEPPPPPPGPSRPTPGPQAPVEPPGAPARPPPAPEPSPPPPAPPKNLQEAVTAAERLSETDPNVRSPAMREAYDAIRQHVARESAGKSKKEALRIQGRALTDDQRAAIHEGLQQLAAVDDYATTIDNVGFSKFDAELGRDLANTAESKSLTPTQAALAQKILRKYKRQLGALYDYIEPPKPVRPQSQAQRAARLKKFDPEKDSLSDFVRRMGGFRFGKGDPVPEVLKSGLGRASNVFRREATGDTPDGMMRLARDEGQFQIPEDMHLEEFLQAVVDDYLSKKGGSDAAGRLWSSMRQFQEANAYEGVNEADILGSEPPSLEAPSPFGQPGQAGTPPAGAEITELPGGFSVTKSPKTGTIGLKGPAGEKVGLRETPDALEFVSIGKGKSPDSRTAVAAMRELGAAKGKPVRFVSTNLSPEGGKFRQRLIDRGELDPETMELSAGAPGGTTPESILTDSELADALKGSPFEKGAWMAGKNQDLLPTEEYIRSKIEEAERNGDMDELYRWKEREAIINESGGGDGEGGALIDPELRDFPFPQPGELRPGEAGFINIADIWSRIVGKKEIPFDMPQDYAELLKERSMFRQASTDWTNGVEWMKNATSEKIRQFYDRDLYVRRFADAAARGGAKEIPFNKDPRLMMDLIRGGTASRMNWVGLQLIEARSAAAHAGLLRPTTMYLDLTGWRRAIQVIEERMDKAFKDRDYEKFAEYRTQLAKGEIVPKGYTKEKIAAAMEAMETALGPEQFDAVRQYAGQFHSTMRKLWDLLHDMEVIPKAIYEQGLARGEEYAPLYRMHQTFMDDPEWGGFSSLNMASRKALKRLEGSPLSTVDPWEAGYIWGTRAVRDAAKNEAMVMVHDLKQIDPEGIGKLIIDLPSPAMKPPLGFTKLSYYRFGDKRTFAVPDKVATSLVSATPAEVNLITQLAQGARRALQIGAVSGNLAFAAPNIAADVGRFWALSRAGSPLNPKSTARIMRSVGRGLGDVIMKDPWYKEMLWHRAAGGTYAKNISPEVWMDSPFTPKTVGKKAADIVLGSIPKIINVTEETTKMASYRLLRERGFSPQEAAAETRRFAGTPDVARRGSSGPMLNLLFMFFNVGLQGKVSTVSRLARNPRRLFELGIASALSAAALWTWNAQYRDDDGEPEWKHVPEYDKKNYFPILMPWVNPETGRHMYFKIKKPFELRGIYNPIEQGLWEVTGQMTYEDRQYWQMLMDLGESTIPAFPEVRIGEEGAGEAALRNIVSSANPIASVPIELLSNRDYFRGRPIVPRGLEDVLPAEQFTPRTSPTAVMAGQATGTSPMKIEHGFQSFGGLGEQALQVADPITQRFSPQQPGMYRGAEEIPVFGAIIRRFFSEGYSDQVQRDVENAFYRYLQEATKTANSYTKMDSARAERWRMEDPRRDVLIDLQPQLRKTATLLSGLRKERRDILDNPAMSDVEKGMRSREILDDMIRIALEDGMQVAQAIEGARGAGRGQQQQAQELPFVTMPPAPSSGGGAALRQ